MMIKEIAQKLNITPRTIRFYVEKGLIHPQKKRDSGYRIFTEEDAWRLQTILTLREVGMSIPTIQRVLNEIDTDDRQEVQYYLQLQRSVLFSEWVRLKRMIGTLNEMIDQYERDAASWEKLWSLAAQSRRIKEVQEGWWHRWNFDRQAPYYDEMIKQKRSNEFDVHRDYERGLDAVVDWTAPQPSEIGLEKSVSGQGTLPGASKRQGYRSKE